MWHVSLAMPTLSSSSVSLGFPHGEWLSTRSEGICGAQTHLLLQTTWALRVKSHRLTYSTAWVQPCSQSSFLMSKEPSPYHNYNLLVVFTWVGKPLMKASPESTSWHCDQWHLKTPFMTDRVLEQGWDFLCGFLEGT